MFSTTDYFVAFSLPMRFVLYPFSISGAMEVPRKARLTDQVIVIIIEISLKFESFVMMGSGVRIPLAAPRLSSIFNLRGALPVHLFSWLNSPLSSQGASCGKRAPGIAHPCGPSWETPGVATRRFCFLALFEIECCQHIDFFRFEDKKVLRFSRKFPLITPSVTTNSKWRFVSWPAIPTNSIFPCCG